MVPNQACKRELYKGIPIIEFYNSQFDIDINQTPHNQFETHVTSEK